MSRHDIDEFEFVNRFLRCEGLAYRPEKQPPGDAPDFLLFGAGQPIGLEVTRVHRDSGPNELPRKQMEGIRDKVLRGARKAWDGADRPPVEVHCHFNPHRTPLPQEVRYTIHELVAAVAENLPAPGAWVTLHRLEMTGARLPAAVHTVTIFMHLTGGESYWAGADSAWEAEVTIGALTERIEAKNQKLPRYQRSISPNWLLLVMDSGRFSGMMQVPKDVLEHRFPTAFARTFLLDSLELHVWELQALAPIGPSA